VDAPRLLAPLLEVGAGAELLWCAALLEAPVHARLPALDVDEDGARAALARVEPLAPDLAACAIALVPSLRLRGRVHSAHIWIGAPCTELAVDAEHVAWQAAHEATVREVARGGVREHDALERAALALLESRARAAGLAHEHARWRARFAP
jgi:hypothetical protein